LGVATGKTEQTILDWRRGQSENLQRFGAGSRPFRRHTLSAGLIRPNTLRRNGAAREHQDGNKQQTHCLHDESSFSRLHFLPLSLKNMLLLPKAFCHEINQPWAAH
jgi:hypothetical protein